MDIKMLSYITFPHLLNYVIAIDGFLGRENFLRHIGGICKRKFTTDFKLVEHIEEVIKNKHVLAMFPEARYSLCGTTAILPKSLARLCKHLDVPVVTLMMHGHHINSPFWNLHNRKIKGIEAELKCLITKEELEEMSIDEIDEKIQQEFIYDEYAWQLKKKIPVTYEGRAEGLHKVLYKCPNCDKEYYMSSSGHTLKCDACGKTWDYSIYGELTANEGKTEFSHIPDWYEWERDEVRKEVEEGKYYFESPVHVDLLPKDKFIPIGKATLIHNNEGFKLKGVYQEKEYELNIPSSATYGVHIEYEYLGKFGDCVDLNTIDNTYYVYPECERFSVTKISLATEEIFKYLNKKK
jgi:ribosomal protein L37AE/L43A